MNAEYSTFVDKISMLMVQGEEGYFRNTWAQHCIGAVHNECIQAVAEKVTNFL